MTEWLAPFETPWDVIGFVLFVLVFPVYHTVYPWLSGRLSRRAARGRFDLVRESWIERILESGDVITAIQQTRNLTMVNSLLVSSALILLGVTANLLVQLPQMEGSLPHPRHWDLHPEAVRVKLYLLIVVFVLTFTFCMTALRHLGNFGLLLGADPKVVEEQIGPPVKYFASLINRASHRHTLGVRSFYAAVPLFVWLFDSKLFLFLTLFWGLRFAAFQDFRIFRFDPADASSLGDEIAPEPLD